MRVGTPAKLVIQYLCHQEDQVLGNEPQAATVGLLTLPIYQGGLRRGEREERRLVLNSEVSEGFLARDGQVCEPEHFLEGRERDLFRVLNVNLEHLQKEL